MRSQESKQSLHDLLTMTGTRSSIPSQKLKNVNLIISYLFGNDTEPAVCHPMLDKSPSSISRSIAPADYNISGKKKQKFQSHRISSLNMRRQRNIAEKVAHSRFSLAKLEAAAATTSDLREVGVDGGRREGHHEEVLCWKAQEEKGEVDIRRRAALCYVPKRSKIRGRRKQLQMVNKGYRRKTWRHRRGRRERERCDLCSFALGFLSCLVLGFAFRVSGGRWLLRRAKGRERRERWEPRWIASGTEICWWVDLIWPQEFVVERNDEKTALGKSSVKPNKYLLAGQLNQF